MAKTSNIPSGLVPEKAIDRVFEMRSAMNLPYLFGSVEIKPLTLGVLSLLEFAGVQAFRTIDGEDIHGIAMMIWIINNRKNAASLVLDYRNYHDNNIDAEVYKIGDMSTAHKLDIAVLNFVGESNLYSPENYNAENILAMFTYIYSSFYGREMLPSQGKVSKQQWIYDAPSLTNGILVACSTLNVDYEQATWEVPMSLISHAATSDARSNGVEHISRPPDIEFFKEYMARTVYKEMKGKLNLWQYREPVNYELSEMQVEKGGETLMLKYNRLRVAWKKQKKETRKKHFDKYSEMLTKEAESIKKKIGSDNG